MSDESEGLRIARELIAKEKEERTGFLDLGRLGLRSWPEELWELEHLTGLNLGGGWYENGEWRKAESGLAPNRLNSYKAYLSRFPRLECLGINNMGWKSLRPLSNLISLQSLDCSDNPLITLEPLAELTSLRFLRCSITRLVSLKPLAGLASLQFLDCSGNKLTTLEPLAELSSLQALDCRSNKLTTLEPLAKLTSLRSLICSHNQLTTLNPLSELGSLQCLVCHSNQLITLQPLTRLVSLQSLDCSSNKLATLEPLAKLTSLQSLNCSNNQIATLEGLERLSSLQSLHCSSNRITKLNPLSGLSSLQHLNCAQNHVPTLESIMGLASLQSLDCWSNPVERLPEQLVWKPSLQTLILNSPFLDGTPAEALSQVREDNCLPRLRAHFRDLEKGGVLLPDVKVMVLGNGRTGKTQLCNRLRGLPFEENANTTHSITVAPQQFGPDTLLRLWDFGGQDIYHGTHALFMRSRAVFVLVWTPHSENSETHEHGGMTFRNQPLAWWQSFVRHMAGSENPVILVQSQCDRPEDRRLRLPVTLKELEELEAFPFCQVLNYSAISQRGKAALGEAIMEAVAWLREKQGHSSIGIGRLAVKNRLEAMLAEDNPQRRPRTLSMEQYEEICAECGDVSSPALLLEYLHLSGIVLHRPGLFGDRIILDQRWALEAVYSVFNRDKCFRQLRQLHGRMNRTLLEALVWQDCTEEEQELFLDFMLSCGICFIHRNGNKELGFETEYIAPDLLPDHAAVAGELAARWKDELPFDEAAVELTFPHPGVMRALLSRIGNLAGMAPVYWRDGVCLYECTRRSHALIEQRLDDKLPRIVIRTRGYESMALLEELARWVQEAAKQSGLREVHMQLPQSAHARDWVGEESRIPHQDSKTVIIGPMPPSETTTYAVSYSWKEESRETVEQLCQKAETRGIRILRDKTDVGLGEKLSKFMTYLAGRDQVFVILSDAYLRSENCMFELGEVWRLSQQDEAKFHERVRVFQLPDARIRDRNYQLDIIEHWEGKQEEMRDRLSARMDKRTIPTDINRWFNSLESFAKLAADIMPVIADRLLPKDFEEFAAHVLRDGISNP